MTDQGSASTIYCYRHPDRPTRLSCTECGRPVCVECSRDAAVGQKCPECAKPIGRNRVIDARTIRRVDRSTTPVTWALIAINAGIFLLGMASPEMDRRIFVDFSQYRPLIDDGEIWRLVTSMFVHANVTHILFNMWALYLFGPALERRFGSMSFASLYVACGLGGASLYYAVGRLDPAVGASGAIFGLMGALLAATYRQRHTPAGRAVFSQLMLLLGINLALPFVIPNIAWEAHVGGLVAGIAISTAWDQVRHGERGSGVQRVIVALGVAVAAVAVVFIF